MQRICHDVLKELGIKDSPLLEVAMALEKIALNDEYFIEKKLYPNIDFYSGITLNAMGFPVSMFTVLFAVARTAGWIAQWKEMIEDPTQKIGRPRQLYIGPPRRDYVPVDQRSRLASSSSARTEDQSRSSGLLQETVRYFPTRVAPPGLMSSIHLRALAIAANREAVVFCLCQSIAGGKEADVQCLAINHHAHDMAFNQLAFRKCGRRLFPHSC